MSFLLERVSALNDMILEGKLEEAFEEFYSEEIEMQENDEASICGKALNRKRGRDFFGAISDFRSARPLNVAVGEGVTMVKWHFDYTHKIYGECNFTQVAVQEWKDGLIVKEQFLYNTEKRNREF